MEDQEILGYNLVMTCVACPEQYDVFDSEGKQVGYLRLRGGRFRVEHPNCGGETVYSHTFDNMWKGIFKEEEREFYLTEAVKALQNYIETNKETP